MAQTNMTKAQLDAFYGATNSSFFGYQLQHALAQNFDLYECPSAVDIYPELTFIKNCSAEFIANSQWGASMITLSPPYSDEDYFPTGKTLDGTNETLSVTVWGVPGITNSPEYFWYSQFHYKAFSGAQTSPALDAWQVGNLTDTSYTYNGIGSTYGAKTLYWYYVTNNYANEKPYLSDTMVQWGLSSNLKVYEILATLDW